MLFSFLFSATIYSFVQFEVEEEGSEVRNSVLSFGSDVVGDNTPTPVLIPCLDEFRKNFKEKQVYISVFYCVSETIFPLLNNSFFILNQSLNRLFNNHVSLH